MASWFFRDRKKKADGSGAWVKSVGVSYNRNATFFQAQLCAPN